MSTTRDEVIGLAHEARDAGHAGVAEYADALAAEDVKAEQDAADTLEARKAIVASNLATLTDEFEAVRDERWSHLLAYVGIQERYVDVATRYDTILRTARSLGIEVERRVYDKVLEAESRGRDGVELRAEVVAVRTALKGGL